MATASTSEGFAGPNGAEQLLAVAQLVLTATEFAGVTGVQIMVAGRSAQAPTSRGALATGPVGRAGFADLLAT